MDEVTKFRDLCLFFEDIKRSQKQKRLPKLQAFMEKSRLQLQTMEQQTGKQLTLFPLLRLILPSLDRARGAYGVKETKLAHLYIRILSIPRSAPDAKKMLEYRNPSSNKSTAQDFADFAFLVLRDRLPKGQDVTVKYVNDELDKLAGFHASKEGDSSEKVLEGLMMSLSALEQKWLIRIILKDLKLGTGQNGILTSFHPDAKDLYDRTNSLEKVCEKLKDFTVRLFEFEIGLFTPFKPMLAERGYLGKIDTFLSKGDVVLEMKLDGERQQLHKSGATYKYFSRNCFDYSSNFGASPHSGSLTPYVHELFSSSVQSCILDGEMMVYSSTLGVPIQKGENYDVKSLKQEWTNLHPCFYAFDILYLNGEVLTSKPLRERLKILETVFTQKEGRLMQTYRKLLTGKQMVIDELNRAIDRREEGLILKDVDSIYAPNSRKAGWIKIKPEYSGVLGDHLDLLIIGGYYGDGRRRGLISSFLLATAVPPSSPGEEMTFHSITRVGSGYTLDELQKLLEKLEGLWKKVNKDVMPKNIVWTREKPDVYVDPQNSYVLEVKASEFSDSDFYATKFTLRFPRVEHVRYDKSYKDTTTLQELLDIKEKGGGKLFSRPYDENGETLEKRRKVPKKKEVTLAPQFVAADLSSVLVEKDLFRGKEFCVINGRPDNDKVKLEKIISTLGGSVVQNPGPQTAYVVAQNVGIRVKNLVKSEKYDIIKPDWIVRCNYLKKLSQFLPTEAIFLTESTRHSLSKDFDEYGDSYSERLGLSDLKQVFEGMKGDFAATKVEIAEVESVEFTQLPKYSLFRPYFISVQNGSEALKLYLQLFGAFIVDEGDGRLTHVIVSDKDGGTIERLKDVRRRREGKFFVVKDQWVRDSVERGWGLPEDEYLL